MSRQRVWGITGWKDAGKTTLTERLVAEMVGRGLRVSTVKHAHAGFDIDHEGRDSHRHRMAGASEVLVASPRRWAMVAELRGEAEPGLDTLLARLSPADIVLVEGYKAAPHPKIEVIAPGSDRRPIACDSTAIRAYAGAPPPGAPELPVFGRDAVGDMAGFILAELGVA